MNKAKTIRVIKILNTTLACILSPIMIVGSIYGLDAFFRNGFSDPWAVATLGYMIAFIFSLLSFKKNYFLWLSLAGWLIFALGSFADSKTAMDKNAQLCIELRTEPSCVEDECGFVCSNFHGAEFTTGGSICEDKNMTLCQEKRSAEVKKDNATQDVLDVYSKIVDKIVASSSPANENFENQLVAIYNCLEEKFGPGATGELKATEELRQKNLTEEQMQKYRVYHSSKGRNLNPKTIVAGLPNGDKTLSCEYVNVK